VIGAVAAAGLLVYLLAALLKADFRHHALGENKSVISDFQKI
jgi:K+-transporting ATPase KdpF subunit